MDIKNCNVGDIVYYVADDDDRVIPTDIIKGKVVFVDHRNNRVLCNWSRRRFKLRWNNNVLYLFSTAQEAIDDWIAKKHQELMELAAQLERRRIPDER